MKKIKYGKVSELGEIETMLVDPSNEIHLKIAAKYGFLPLENEGDEASVSEDECEDLESVELRYRTEGDRVVRYRERVSNSPKMVKRRIKQLTAQLASSDYKIIKCHEQSMVGDDIEYDIEELHQEREQIREQIRELEGLTPSYSAI